MTLEMRRKLARQSFEEKVRKVGELIQLAGKIRTPRTHTTAEHATLLERLDTASSQLDAGKGVPIERVREKIHGWAKNSKK